MNFLLFFDLLLKTSKHDKLSVNYKKILLTRGTCLALSSFFKSSNKPSAFEFFTQLGQNIYFRNIMKQD